MDQTKILTPNNLNPEKGFKLGANGLYEVPVDNSTIAFRDGQLTYINPPNPQIPFCDAIEDLRNLDTTEPGKQINLVSYHRGTMLGGGIFYADLDDITSEDNEGTIIVSTSGVRWKRLVDNKLLISQFGAKDDLNFDSTNAFKNALNYLKNSKIKILVIDGSMFKISDTLTIPSGVTIQGQGVGAWDTIFADRKKEWNGTSLIFDNVTSKERINGISTCSSSDTNQTLDNGEILKLTSLVNKDLKVAVKFENEARHSTIKDLRIVPNLSDLNNYSNTSNRDLGADIDVGLLVRNNEYCSIDNVQIVGYWRVAGVAMLNDDFDYGIANERNTFVNCKFQGQVGLLIRAGEQIPVKSATSNSITVKASDDFPYSNSGGQFTGWNDPSYIRYNYTSLTRNGDSITFNGVVPNPSHLQLVRSPYRSTGVAGSNFDNCIIAGLDHHSGLQSQELGFELSKALEISGFPIRGLCFFNSKPMTKERCVAFFNDCNDILFVNSQFEESFSGGGYIIGTYYTKNLRLVSTIISGCNRDKFNARSFYSDIENTNCNVLNGNLEIKARENKDLNFITQKGKRFNVYKSDGNKSFDVTDSGNMELFGSFSLRNTKNNYLNFEDGSNFAIRKGLETKLNIYGKSGTIAPGSDNSQYLGASSGRWREIFSANGVINTSDETLKGEIKSIDDKVLDAWEDVKIINFKWLEAIAKKSSKARIHTGVLAQAIERAFKKHGLDATRYSLICIDKIADDKVRYGIRADQCLFLEAQCNRRKLSCLENRLAKLENDLYKEN